MNNTIAKTFAMAAVTALALSIATTAKADDKGCSNATLQGTFAYTSTGSITSPPDLAGPIAEVGAETFDGKGTTAATATLSSNGTILQLAITGTYTVNSDCTGTMELQVVSPFQATVDVYFVIDNAGDEFQGMETNTGFVITRVARRLFPGRSI